MHASIGGLAASKRAAVQGWLDTAALIAQQHRLLVASPIQRHLPSCMPFLIYSGCLALLINLVEHQPAWRDQLRQLQLPDTSHG